MKILPWQRYRHANNLTAEKARRMAQSAGEVSDYQGNTTVRYPSQPS